MWNRSQHANWLIYSFNLIKFGKKKMCNEHLYHIHANDSKQMPET